MITFPEAAVDPPDPMPPCECNVRRAKGKIEDAVDAAFYECGLEYLDTVSIGEVSTQIANLIDSIVQDVTGTCERCR